MEGVQPPGTERFYMYINTCILNVTLIKLEKCFIYSHSRRSIYLKSIDLYTTLMLYSSQMYIVLTVAL